MSFKVVDRPGRIKRSGKWDEFFKDLAALPPNKALSVSPEEMQSPSVLALRATLYGSARNRGINIGTSTGDNGTLNVWIKSTVNVPADPVAQSAAQQTVIMNMLQAIMAALKSKGIM